MRKEPRVPLQSKVIFSIEDKLASGLIGNLSLNGAFVQADICPPKDSLIDLSLTLPSLSESLDIMAKVNRIATDGFAAEFVGIDSTTVPYVWSLVQSRLKSLGECPYCGEKMGSQAPSHCPRCEYPLQFNDPYYFEKRDSAETKMTLMSFINDLSETQVGAVHGMLKKYFMTNGNSNGDGDVEVDPVTYQDEMIGTSQKMNAVFRVLKKVATVDVPVLLIGETGTGKEMAARAIHQRSLRADGPFIPINCGAIPKDLLESELFGHEKGAFTGADKQVKGRIEYAQGGTLFLDEVGELPLNLQVKLLRFLEDFKVERVGGRDSIGVDLRVIAATNRDLEKEIAEGRFREDLYYRLNVITVRMPALRERGDDVLVMAEIFLRKYSNKAERKINGFTREGLAALKGHQWPGNVRELVNRIRRAVVMAEHRWITPENLELKPGKGCQEGLREATKRFESDLIKETIHQCGGRITEASRMLKISRSDMYYLLKKHGITRIPRPVKEERRGVGL